MAIEQRLGQVIGEGEELVEADDSLDFVEGREVCCRSGLDEAGRGRLKGRDVGLEGCHADEG